MIIELEHNINVCCWKIGDYYESLMEYKFFKAYVGGRKYKELV